MKIKTSFTSELSRCPPSPHKMKIKTRYFKKYYSSLEILEIRTFVKRNNNVSRVESCIHGRAALNLEQER